MVFVILIVITGSITFFNTDTPQQHKIKKSVFFDSEYDEFLLQKSQIKNPLESKKFCQCLAAALWLDQHVIPEDILEASDINPSIIGLSPNEIDQKKKGLAHFFKFTYL